MIEIIAEIGINWNGDMDLLKELIFQAKECGANMAKTQLYSPSKLFPAKEILVDGKNWYSEVEKTEMSKSQLYQFIEWCREAEIEPIASAFDTERLSWLDYGVKKHKVASIFNRNKEYIDAVIATGKEVLLSCRDRTNTYHPPIQFREKIKYLYCIPKYPTLLTDLKFSRIGFMGHYQGLSDHSEGIEASMVAMSRGATIIEKHFCLERDNSNPDMICSIEPAELRQLVDFARKVEMIL